ncbi:hypothetical protein [Coprococcus sp. AF21-14LB]|uniref:hypothetical protein n=1 Tax=Coprococcus sp. AF21-14LB TaxID=2292231 RepID=UPI000E51439A|nr:hypothetical protein [Coprococcus sp. AF21-14LB]RGS77029.1 hypothetical protein DWX73_11130 [Coprococcus sp. AF21-14LB]
MKKGKKGWLLLMAFTTWAVLIAGCGKWTGNKQDKVPEVTMAGSDTENMENPENSQSTPLPDIQELTYYVHGTMMELIRSVSLIRQGEKALVRIEPGMGKKRSFLTIRWMQRLLIKHAGFWKPMMWHPGQAFVEAIPMS